MDDQNKSVNDRWAPPADRRERGYATDPGFSSGAEYSSSPDRLPGGVDDQQPPERRTAEIRGEIDQTRAEMSETIDAIQDRLRPANVASRAAESVRDATVGRVKEFAESFSGRRGGRDDDWRYESYGWDGSRGNVVFDHIRRNPMAAAVAAGSIAWLIFGSGRRGQRQRWSQDDRERAIYGSTRQGEAFVEERRFNVDRRPPYERTRGRDEWSETATERAREWSESGREIADRARHAAVDAGDRVKYAASTAQRRTRDFAAESPFAVGAIAAALGLAIGLTIPETERENELLGDARDSMVDRGKDAVRTAAERVQTAAGEVQRVAGDALKGMTSGEPNETGSEKTQPTQTSGNQAQVPSQASGTRTSESAVPGMQAGSGGTGATPTRKPPSKTR